MTIETFRHLPSENLESQLLTNGVPADKAALWAKAGGAQQLRLSRTQDQHGNLVFLWEAHRGPTRQLVIRDWATTGQAHHANEALRVLTQDAADDALSSGYPLIKAQVTANDSAFSAVLQDLGFQALPAPISKSSLEHAEDTVEGWVRWLTVTPPTQAPVYLRQRTDFTCGPATLIMAAPQLGTTLDSEVALWREATYVVGTDHWGLAAALHERGVQPTVYTNQAGPLLHGKGSGSLTEGAVRDALYRLNVSAAQDRGVKSVQKNLSVATLRELVDQGQLVAVLIDELTLNAETCAHWVLVWGASGDNLFIHDPWTDEDWGETWVESWGIPIEESTFWQMAAWGENQSRAFVALPAPSDTDAS